MKSSLVHFMLNYMSGYQGWLRENTISKEMNLRSGPLNWYNDLRVPNNRISRVADFWIDSILGGFITEFMVYSIVSYSKAKWKFFEGPQGKYLRSMNSRLRCFCVKRKFYECSQIISLLVFRRRSEEENGTTRSGKIYRIDTRNRSHGKNYEGFYRNWL